MNLCDTCIHRKVCCCEDPTMPTEDCRYYDPIPKHGLWETELDDMGWIKHTCPFCGYVKRTDIHVALGWNFCPKCGSRLDGDTNDEG